MQDLCLTTATMERLSCGGSPKRVSMTQHALYEHSSGLDPSLSVLDVSCSITGLHQPSDHSAAQGS